ncbi:hypothetical protein KIL84_010583 [Mauremys mutica]|uniref:Uncharacterized protein n=1 Tax=Mauremys mutica TaxID=74926 RepID=A0A9D4B1I8_9SAUR|nr:hypothetical protein KIL84_010583 [Mauremys mutica]
MFTAEFQSDLLVLLKSERKEHFCLFSVTPISMARIHVNDFEKSYPVNPIQFSLTWETLQLSSRKKGWYKMSGQVVDSEHGQNTFDSFWLSQDDDELFQLLLAK